MKLFFHTVILKNRCLPLILFFLSVNLLLHINLQAQLPTSEAALYQTALKNMIASYAEQTGGYLNLYNGSAYAYTYAGVKGHPYYKTDSFQLSRLLYDQVLYENIPLKFDMVVSEVLIRAKEDRVLQLVPAKLQYFTIGDDLFIQLKKDSADSNAPDAGYYQLLYDGPLTALVSRKKVAIRGLKAEDPYQFASYNKYYIKKDQVYYRIESQRELLAVFGDKKAAVKDYLKKSKLNFKKDPEATIVKAVAHLRD